MKITLDRLRAAGFATKAMVGGAQLTQAHADEIDADGYASDAPGAVAPCKGTVA